MPSGFMSPMMTRAPSATNSSTTAFPIPEAPPVTIATSIHLPTSPSKRKSQHKGHKHTKNRIGLSHLENLCALCAFASFVSFVLMFAYRCLR